MPVYPRIEDAEYVAVDTETTGLKWHSGDRVFGVAITLPDMSSYYYDIRRDEGAVDWMREAFPRLRKVVNHNVKFDIHMLRQSGILLNPRACECTMLRATLIDEHLMRYSLDHLARRYLKQEKVKEIWEELAMLFGGNPTREAQIKNLPRAPRNLVAEYATKDTELAMQLWKWQEEEIERQNLHQIWALEHRVFPRVVEMESRGVRVDEQEAEIRAKRLDKAVADLQVELNNMAGFVVNPNPSGSIKKLFRPEWDKDREVWVARDGTVLNSTPSGAPSLDADALKLMTDPAAKLVLRARKLTRAKDVFLRGHVLGHAVDGYVYPTINQSRNDTDSGVEGVGPGRFSYTRPALQQIPSRDKEMAEMVRPVFLPDEGQGWSYGDLDQHEYRVFIHYARPPAMLRAYAENPDLDMHQKVADLTNLPRSAESAGAPNAKQLNLGMVFCMGGGKLCAQMGLPYTRKTANFDGEERVILVAGPEGEEVMENYYRMVPGVREVAKKAKSIAKSRGYVVTLFGRHIRFPGGKKTHKASGLIYQGSSADLNKKNMCDIADYLDAESPDSRMLHNIHDEYSLSMAMDGKQEHHLRELREIVQNKPELRVPIRIDFSKPASNWWDATQAEKVL